LVRVVIAVKAGGEIDAPSRDPIPLYDALIRRSARSLNNTNVTKTTGYVKLFDYTGGL
jgi:hypothetical protein